MHVDPHLASVIAEIESSGRVAAIRFEPVVYKQAPDLSPIISAIGKHNDCNNATARVLYSCSFGAYQIMGFNLWGSLGYRGNLANYFASDENQLQTFGAFLDAHKINYTLADMLADRSKLDQFAAVYNGDVANYSAAILRVAQA